MRVLSSNRYDLARILDFGMRNERVLKHFDPNMKKQEFMGAAKMRSVMRERERT